MMKNGAVNVVLLVALSAVIGCGSGKATKKQDEFFTSGSREADQRASQRMAKERQLQTTPSGGNKDEARDAQAKRTLFERLGGEQGITAIIDDFTARVLADPRVNWERKGVKRGGLFGRNESAAWNPTPQNVTRLKTHLVQFLSLATGGPSKYDGKEMRSAHDGMRIANPEFDAAVGDLKASLDKLHIPDAEQKELLAVVESTRPQIVTER